MDVPELITALEEQGALMADAAERASLDAPVPTCPDWTVRDLVRHTGGVHRWAATHVRDAVPEVIRRDREEPDGGWPSDDELVAWFRDGHEDLVSVLHAAPADLQCATFLVAPSPLAMWARRQAHETAIHRIDAELASGASLPHLAPSFAADGIDELLTCFITRPGRGPRRDAPYRMTVRPDDVDVTWTLAVSSGDVEVERRAGPLTDGQTESQGGDGGGAADLDLAGRADRLYPLLWNRAEVTSVELTGDAALAELWRDGVQVRWR